MYHIFTARKLMLTAKINNIGMQLMQAQFKRDEYGDELLDAYKEYYGIDTESGTEEEITTDSLREDRGIEDANDDDESDEGMQAAILEAKNNESKLDTYIKRLETELSAAQQELQTVEKEEGNAIKRSIPNYSGVGGQ